jgi:hypothetical protein
MAIVCGWLKLHALYYLGVPPDRLAAIYATQTPPAPLAPTGEKPIRVSDRWERSAEL